MTEERNIGPMLPVEVIREDQALETSVESASFELARLRWHWTDDESNPGAVSYSTYARAVGRSRPLIGMYAKGYVLFTQSEKTDLTSMTQAIKRAMDSVDARGVVEAVAQVNNLSYSHARSNRREQVREVRNAVNNEAERREERGEVFAADERADYARKVAETKKRTADREAREREESAKRHTARFMEADAELSKARRALKAALDTIRGVGFTEEEAQLLGMENGAVQGMSHLVGAALTGDSGIDWDAELTKLEEKRQYG